MTVAMVVALALSLLALGLRGSSLAKTRRFFVCAISSQDPARNGIQCGVTTDLRIVISRQMLGRS